MESKILCSRESEGMAQHRSQWISGAAASQMGIAVRGKERGNRPTMDAAVEAAAGEGPSLHVRTKKSYELNSEIRSRSIYMCDCDCCFPSPLLAFVSHLTSTVSETCCPVDYHDTQQPLNAVCDSTIPTNLNTFVPLSLRLHPRSGFGLLLQFVVLRQTPDEPPVLDLNLAIAPEHRCST